MRKLTLGWYLYGEGKLVIGLVTVEGHQPSWRTVRQRDDQKLPVGTVVVAGQVSCAWTVAIAGSTFSLNHRFDSLGAALITERAEGSDLARRDCAATSRFRGRPQAIQ